MKTIHKYKLDMAELAPMVHHRIPMNRGAEIMHIATDYDGSISVWANVDTDRPSEVKELYSFWTGIEMPKAPMKHLATILTAIGIVIHVFEPIVVEAME